MKDRVYLTVDGKKCWYYIKEDLEHRKFVYELQSGRDLPCIFTDDGHCVTCKVGWGNCPHKKNG
jgi:hypothetical protein